MEFRPWVRGLAVCGLAVCGLAALGAGWALLPWAAAPSLAPSEVPPAASPAAYTRPGAPNAQNLPKLPNPSHLPQDWHLSHIQAPEAWAAPGQAHATVVAVLDSGVDPSHPALARRLEPGWNFAHGSADTRDPTGHGTRVAGVVAGVVAGSAAPVRILPLRVTDSRGEAVVGLVVAAMEHAVRRGARVINISFDNAAGQAAIEQAAQRARSQGVVVVTAAGNSGRNPGTPRSSALLVVGGSNPRDERSAWSDYGAHIGVVAPGEGIWTTVAGGGWERAEGTSFSAPLVAGVAALMFSVAPTASAEQVLAWLQASADDLGPPGFDPHTGAGRLNARRAVSLAAGRR